MVYLLPKKDMMANIYILLYKINPLWISGFFHGWSLCEKCPNTEFILVRIFPYSVRQRENTNQRKLRIWTLFTQWVLVQAQ